MARTNCRGGDGAAEGKFSCWLSEIDVGVGGRSGVQLGIGPERRAAEPQRRKALSLSTGSINDELPILPGETAGS